jgi:alkylated DNA repair dioxygenase AlkB
MCSMVYKPNVSGEKAMFLYQKNVFPKEYAAEIKTWLNNLELKSGKCISGKEVPRLQLWFQEDNKYFCEKWKYRYPRWESEPYPDILTKFQSNIIETAQELIIDHPEFKFPDINSALINKYRDGKDSIRAHRDTPDSFGEYPLIVVYSSGATRQMKIKKIIYDCENFASLRGDADTSYDKTFDLEENSLFIMAGASQKYFTHEILKGDTTETRFSITFREYLHT